MAAFRMKAADGILDENLKKNRRQLFLFIADVDGGCVTGFVKGGFLVQLIGV